MADTAPLPEHIERPEIRTFQRMPVERDGQVFVGLRDPSMIAQQMIVLPMQILPVVEHFNGQFSLDEISARLGVPIVPLRDLASKLDEIGMLWGPTFSTIESALRRRCAEAGCFPGAITRMWGEDADACRTAIGALLDAAEDPELGGGVIGVMAPHLDPERGGEIYAAAYRAWVGAPSPARVIVLGTNHFGQGDGVVMSRLGFDTPFGVAQPDAALVDGLVAKLGERLLKDEMDHVGEHSVQLHLPWVQHLFGGVPVTTALVPDPNAPMVADDGARVSFAEFRSALAEVVALLPGRTLVVASCDLSHVGPGFGDEKPVDELQQDEVERHDREMLAVFERGDGDAFIRAIAESQNSTRWCSVGAMSAAIAACPGATMELIDYRQSIDPKRIALVSCAALAWVGVDA
ncbi:MAG: AmmeMemoRadiSam system protein B [Phycisphaeraceae bacterium]|nr:AmmeMemoRadiSam system protein B [Phycisphaeraceae bacterium]